MRKASLFIIVMASFFLGGCSLSVKRSAVEINSFPIAKVYIDGKEMGMTPYKNKNLKPGETEITLETSDKSWIKNIKLQNNVNTVIDWEFKTNSDESGGYILFLEKTGDKKNAGLMAISNPIEATLSIDDEMKGYSPLKIKNINEGDKHLTISSPGFKNLDVFVKAIKGYQLVIETKLIKEETIISEEVSKKSEEKVDNSDLLEETREKITIKETETGWLRVREGSSSASREISRVDPGKEYVLLEEGRDWWKIELETGEEGWVSSSYVSKN